MREQQLKTWSELLLKYHKHTNQVNLNINDGDGPLFINESISRRLPADGRLLVLQQFEKTEHAAALDKNKIQWEVYRNRLDDLAVDLYEWASANRLTGTVCTLYELANDVAGQKLHGLDLNVLIKTLEQLEKMGKMEDKGTCELMRSDDNQVQGVKFLEPKYA